MPQARIIERMAPDDAKVGRKRRSDASECSSIRDIKRAKHGSIMDYMKPRPQHRARPKDASKNDHSSTSQTKKQDTTQKGEDRSSHNPDASKAQSNAPSTSNDPNSLRLTESTGDIFDAPPNSLIVHACNCEGSWGAGIAAAFKQHYMGAFKIYAAHCKQNGHDLFSKALLISPQKLDKKKQHFVGCLFTSRSKGKKKDSPSAILKATKPAMEDLLQQVQKWNSEHAKEEAVGEVRICKINSGLFAVPWEETKEVMESIDVKDFDVKQIKVVSRE